LKLKNFKAPAFFLIFCLAALRLAACGEFFPNNLLTGGDAAVLAAPVANFEQELERMHLTTNSFHAVITTNSFAKDSTDAELSDLQADLKQMGTPAPTAAAILRAHQLERAKLQSFEENIEVGDRVAWDGTIYVHTWIPSALPAPVPSSIPPAPPAGSPDSTTTPTPPSPQLLSPPFPDVRITPGLPEEFADYFAGAIAWENPAMSNSDLACISWEKVLTLPPRQRHFKSTWAAFMLGKYWMDKDSQKAIGYFQQTRSLAAAGFVDSCGLAAASFGQEALADLQRNDYEKALLLYVQQLKTGDGSAVISLEFAAARALATNDTITLKQLAANPVTRRVITAYLISYASGFNKEGQAAKWLVAIEAAHVRDVDSAEEFALAAYQAGEWDYAQRWAERAPESPVAQWLEAKLLLRAGRINQAGTMLAKVVKLMESDDGHSNQLKDELTVDCEDSEDLITASNQVLGELGVLRLSQRDYVESLDSLMHAGYWMDAAYVAERILTAGELKAYVDRNWPEVASPAQKQAIAGDNTNMPPEYWNGWWYQDSVMSPDETDPATSIRYLLARRLARLGRNGEAVAYFPPRLRPAFDAFVGDLKNGHKNSLPADERAMALFAAAVMTRTNGMELFGTELDPDWLIYEGEYDSGDGMRTNDNTRLLVASADELRRYRKHDVQPEERFHYRFQAAELAVEAAKLLPDNSEETARILCTAGSWIKYIDPQKANPIYKTLVRRCEKTDIGWQAEVMHWFPLLDDSGNPIPNKPRGKQNYLIFHDRLDTYNLAACAYSIGSIHMTNRQNGWAENVATLLETNDWLFEQHAILRTTNGGASWRAVLYASPHDSIASFIGDNTAWVAAVYDESTNVSVLETTDGGKSWWGGMNLSVPYPVEVCEITVPAPTQVRLLLMPDHGMNSMPGYLYGLGDDAQWQQINGTTDMDNRWNDPDGRQPGFADRHPYLMSGGPITFLDSTNGWLLGQLTTTTRSFLFFTRDGGATWQEQKFDPPPSLHDGSVVPDGLPQFFGDQGIVEADLIPNDGKSINFSTIFYQTHDGGMTWRPTTPVKFLGVYSFVSDQRGWMWSPEPQDSNSTAPGKGTLYRTDDGGNTWKSVSAKKSLENYLTHGERVIQLDFVDNAYGWAIAQDWRNQTKLLKTTDGGETWNSNDQ
jgi:photosystem II stability/assembly factor-like uncharacterized protein